MFQIVAFDLWRERILRVGGVSRNLIALLVPTPQSLAGGEQQLLELSLEVGSAKASDSLEFRRIIGHAVHPRVLRKAPGAFVQVSRGNHFQNALIRLGDLRQVSMQIRGKETKLSDPHTPQFIGTCLQCSPFQLSWVGKSLPTDQFASIS